MVLVDVTVRPPWPSEPPRSAGPGGLVRIEGGVARRALRVRETSALGVAGRRRAATRTRGRRVGGAARAGADAVRADARRGPRAVPPRVPVRPVAGAAVAGATEAALAAQAGAVRGVGVGDHRAADRYA